MLITDFFFFEEDKKFASLEELSDGILNGFGFAVPPEKKDKEENKLSNL